MQDIKEHLLQAQHDLEGKCEPTSELIDRLRAEGKSMGEIEQAVLELIKTQGVYDSVHRALKILEG